MRKKNSDLSRFLFINWIFQIWTCPDLNLDLSRFEIFDWKFQIWTCPDLNYGHVRIFFFQLKIWNLDLSRFQFRTSYSILTHHVDSIATELPTKPHSFFWVVVDVMVLSGSYVILDLFCIFSHIWEFFLPPYILRITFVIESFGTLKYNGYRKTNLFPEKEEHVNSGCIPVHKSKIWPW